jgi:CheY-like chemotaxis protein
VNAGTGSPIALIVDDDVAFILWLGEMFAETGYRAVPALHCRQALALVKKLAVRIDVLVVNPDLRGAARVIKMLSSEQPNLRVVLIRNPSNPVPDGNHPALERPAPWEPISRPQWVTKIRKLLLGPSAVT